LTLDDETESPALHAAQRRKQNPGLFAVAQRSRARRDMLFRQLRADWLQRAGTWTAAVAAAVVPLDARPVREPQAAPAEPRRRAVRPIRRARSV